MGFAVPLAKWFRGPLLERAHGVLLGPRLAETGMFDHAYLQRVLALHVSGARDFSALIWSLFMFDSFLRQLDGSTDARMPARKGLLAAT
jgi:asparagine synthase (glutamine-hydrolysing)